MRYEIKKIAGIDCVFSQMNDSNSLTVLILAKAGSIYETRQNNGISHFLEHMFFKGGKKYETPKAVAEVVDSFGGEFNAFTGDSYAGYYVKSAPEFAEKAVDVLGDMIINARFPQEEMEREKGVVIQEIKMYEDQPTALVADKRQEYFYGDNSYGWSTLGPVKNIQNFTRDDLIKHKLDLYTKDNLIIIVSGKILDQQAIQDQISQIFKDLPDKKRIDKPVFPGILPTNKEGKYQKGTAQNHLIISAKGFDGHDERRYAASILSIILGGNMSSRLFQNIREKEGLCYYIRSSHLASPHDGVFLIRAGLEKGRFEYGVEKIMLELEKIATGDISPQEFDKAIGFNIGQNQMGIESSDEMANFLGNQYLLYGEIKTLDDILQKVKNVKIQEVIQIAKNFQQDNLYKYWIQ